MYVRGNSLDKTYLHGKHRGWDGKKVIDYDAAVTLRRQGLTLRAIGERLGSAEALRRLREATATLPC